MKTSCSSMSIQNSSSDLFKDSEHIHINISKINTSPQDSFLGQVPEDDDDDEGEIFGVILSRRYEKQQSSMFDNVVRKTMSMRAEKQTPSLGFESAVGRAFSMRATTSAAVSETYCRIDNEDDEENLLTATKAQAEAQNESNNNTKKRNKFFEICKRVFGF